MRPLYGVPVRGPFKLNPRKGYAGQGVIRYGNPRGNDLSGWTLDVYTRVPGRAQLWAVVGMEVRRTRNGGASYHRKTLGWIPHRGQEPWWDVDSPDPEHPNSPEVFLARKGDKFANCNPDGSRVTLEDLTSDD